MTLVRVGERGVDFSFARPSADRLLELGFTFVVGYISVPPASPNKNLTRAEIEVYRDAGLAVGLVWEMDAARPNKGATYGELDGASARREAVKRDWPMDIPIITACDLNSFADNIDRHEMYVRGFHKTVEQEWIGIYGDTDILARTVGVWNIGWVPIGAWAWSGTSKADAIRRAKAVGAHVLQSKGYYIDNIWAVDPNDVIADFPAWGVDTFPPPIDPPNPQPEDDMALIITNDAEHDGHPAASQSWLMMDDGTKRELDVVEKAVRGNTIPERVGNAQLDAIPDWTPGGGTVDQVARDAFERQDTLIVKLNDAVGRTGQVIGDIQKGLGEAAEARS